MLAAEFGLRTEEEVAHFVENMAWGCVLCFPSRATCLRGCARIGRGSDLHACLRCAHACRHGAGPGVMGGALQLWLPVERFDDAMLLLRHTLHWELIDITYAVLFDSRRAAATRWDGKRIKPTPKTKARIAHTHALRILSISPSCFWLRN